MVDDEKPNWNGWFGGSSILGNLHVDVQNWI
jgi:hypothetical protein